MKSQNHSVHGIHCRGSHNPQTDKSRSLRKIVERLPTHLQWGGTPRNNRREKEGKVQGDSVFLIRDGSKRARELGDTGGYKDQGGNQIQRNHQ